MADETVRQYLRRSTRDAHEALDRDLGCLDLTDRGDYALFLQRQFLARGPIEAWLRNYAPAALIPPEQVPLIESDLEALGANFSRPHARPFLAPADGAIGVAWAIAGSSLGNRAMLRNFEKAGTRLPTTFLADPAMPAYFVRLRPRIETTVTNECTLATASEAALAVFAFFADVASDADHALENAA